MIATELWGAAGTLLGHAGSGVAPKAGSRGHAFVHVYRGNRGRFFVPETVAAEGVVVGVVRTRRIWPTVVKVAPPTGSGMNHLQWVKRRVSERACERPRVE